MSAVMAKEYGANVIPEIVFISMKFQAILMGISFAYYKLSGQSLKLDGTNVTIRAATLTEKNRVIKDFESRMYGDKTSQ